MFVRAPVSFGRLWLAVVASVVLHVSVLLFLACLPETAFLLPAIAPRTNNSQVTLLLPRITLARASNQTVSARKKSMLHSRRVISRAAPKPVPPDTAGDLGPILKTSNLWRIPSIHEVKLALPQVAPLPSIARSELPADFEGDIVVEITIDKDGKVARTRVLQSFGQGLEAKVVATLVKWRFTPASFDGVPVASLQDISFHYPENALP